MTQEATPVEPREAATVVLLRPAAAGLEVLLTHRPTTMAFAADMHVFPGGRVDGSDSAASLAARSVLDAQAAAVALGDDLEPERALAAFVAAIRELWEEVGVLLGDTSAGASDVAAARLRLLGDPGAFPAIADALDLRLRTDQLVPLSRWVTPPTMDRRFDARFFAASLPDAAATSLVGEEVTAHDWWTPRTALDAMAAGRIGMWIPTSATLQQLEHATSLDEIAARLAPVALGEVVVEDVDRDVTRVRMPAGGGVAGQPIDAYLVGSERVVLVDPGDPTGPGLDRALEVVASRGGRVAAVVLTHIDPDHAGGAEAIAEQCGVPVFASPERARDLPYPVEPLVDGRRLEVGDVPLTVVAAPGPTPDHLALIVGSGALVITGDLDAVRGARSIPGPVDEAAWARSREAVRAAAPGAGWLGGHPTG